MKKLNNSTVKLISSSYVISSIEVLVKELVENSIDAGSNRIWIYLKKFGLEKIEVIDDGIGIDDVSLICQRHCTSKISEFSDIENAETFGFRGEVLSSICAVSNLSITSSSNAKFPIGNTWVFDKMGNVIAQTPISCKQGTTISVSNIFHNLPVRCQMYKSLFILQKSLKLIIRYLQQLYLSRNNIQIHLLNDSSVVLSLPICSSRSDSISSVIGPNKFKFLSEITVSEPQDDGVDLKLNIFVPNCVDNKNGLTNHDSKENCHLFINNRPVEVPILFKAVRNAYKEFTNDNKNRFPTSFIFLTLPRFWVDVNIDPDKRKIKLSNIESVSTFIEKSLNSFYDSLRIDNPQDVISLTLSETSKFPETETNENQNSTENEYFNNEHERKSQNIHNVSDVFSNSLASDIDIDLEHHSFSDKEYALGKLKAIKDVPTINANVQRYVQSENDSVEIVPVKRRKKTEESKPNDAETCSFVNSITEAPTESRFSAHLSLTSLEKEKKTENKRSSNFSVVSCWDAFVIAVEMDKSNITQYKEVNHMVIFSKKHLLRISTYLDKIANTQVQAEKLPHPIRIDDNNHGLVLALQKLPDQLIVNKSTGENFRIISCPHFIKNGYRIHSLTCDGNPYFEVVSKPLIVDTHSVLNEIETIVELSVSSKRTVRTPTVFKWINSFIDETVELKWNSEVAKLTTMKSRDYFDSCLSKVRKYRVDEELPELFRFCLN